MRRKQEGYLPFNDDKPKYAENPAFEASALLVVKANTEQYVRLYIIID